MIFFKLEGFYGFQRPYFKNLNLSFEIEVVYGYSEFYGGLSSAVLEF